MRENRTYGLMRGPGETHTMRGAGFYSTMHIRRCSKTKLDSFGRMPMCQGGQDDQIGPDWVRVMMS